MFYLYSYNQNSVGATELANALDITRIKHRNSRFVGGLNKTVINWGSSSVPEQVSRCRMINHPDAIEIASHKLRTFQAFEVSNGVNYPSYTTNIGIAQDWLARGHTVMARTVLQGHSGAGIVIMDPNTGENADQRAPLYTKYVKKSDEFRVHVLRNEIICIQRKGLSAEFQGRDDINWKVRNLANGFVYTRNDVVISEDAKVQARRAVAALGLDFGAVDLIFNRNSGTYYVLEVNTAPGLVGATVQDYANAFRRVLNIQAA